MWRLIARFPSRGIFKKALYILGDGEGGDKEGPTEVG